MKTTAILLAVAMIAMVTPISSADEEKDACDNQAYFEEILGTRPDDYVRPVVREHLGDKVPPASGDVIMTEEEHVEFVAGHAAALADRADSIDVCMETLVSGAEETGGFPIVSEFFLLLEISYDYGQHFCANGDSVGAGGHYTAATDDPAAGSHPWSWGSAEFVGAALSSTSHAETAYYTYGFAGDVLTGKGFNYAQDVVYAGASDFYCYGYFDPFFQDYPTTNFPYSSGAVVGL